MGKHNDGKKVNENETLKVKKGDLVKVDYIAALRNGIIFDTSIGFEADNCGIIDQEREYNAMEFIVGNSVIKSIDEHIVGMTINESKTFVIKPEDAFGLRDGKKVIELPKTTIPKREPIIGEHFVIMDKQKNPRSCFVKEIRGDLMLVDFNHPLAGHEIIMTVKVLCINGKPSASEKKSEDTNEEIKRYY